MYHPNENNYSDDKISVHIDKVKVIRDKESIVGDYARINTLDESYKVTSNKSDKKVRVLLKEKEDE